jgi:hypothetical protein
VARLGSFEEFWPFYVAQHSRASTRALHFAGSTLVLGSLAAAALVSPWLALAAPVVGYGRPGSATSSARRTGPRPSPIRGGRCGATSACIG